jgi:phosphate transport system protein
MLASQGRPRAGSIATAIRPDRRLIKAGQRSGVQESDRFVAHGHRDVFSREMQQVRADVVRMGELVSGAIDAAVGALSRMDLRAATEVVAEDARINLAQTELSSLIITTIATQAPVAGDLRFLISLSHVSYELERIGDHAAGVARHTVRLLSNSKDGRLAGNTGLDRLGELASSVLHGVLLALVDLDVEAARRVAAQDDEMDRLYHAYFSRTLEKMRQEPTWVDVGAHLLFAAKDLERIGDRVTNIAEEVVFLSTGVVEDLNP